MKKFTVLLLLAAAIFLSGCTFSAEHGLEVQPSFASELTRNCGTISEGMVVDAITGFDADGTRLSFWTPTFKGIQMAVEEAEQFCPQLGAEDISILWPEYRCQFRINIELEAAACQLP